MSTLTKKLDAMNVEQLWRECEVLHGHIKAKQPNGMLDQMFRDALQTHRDLEPDETPEPGKMRLCLLAFMALPPAKRKAMLNGWCYEPGWTTDAEYIADVASLKDHFLTPAMELYVGRSDFCVRVDDFPTEGFIEDNVTVRVRFGTPASEVVKRLRQLAGLVAERWGNLPGINPNGETFASLPLGNVKSRNAHEKGGVPQTHSTGQIQTPNGEKARAATAA